MAGFFSRLFGRSPTVQSSPAATCFAIGGHGLSLAPVCPCAVIHREDGTLFFSFGVVGTERTLLLVPGTAPATHPPLRVAGISPQRFTMGPNGPSLSLGAGLEDPSEVLLRVDVGLGEAPWNILSHGAWMEFPRALSLYSAASDDPWFELHLGADPDRNTFLSFIWQPEAPASLVITPRAGQRLDGEGEVEADTGPVRWVQLAYEVAGAAWRQRFYVLAYAGGSLLVRAQSPVATAPQLFSSADHVARSYSPSSD